jgi:membrane protease YdiL (CAAX protease family)
MNKDKRIDSPLFTYIVAIVSALVWLLMNVPFTPRFTLASYVATSGMYLSLAINAVFGIILLVFRQKKRAFIPFFFAMFPLAYLITAKTGYLIFGSDFTGSNFPRKILYDCYFFLTEIACISALALIFKRPVACFGFKKQNQAKKEGGRTLTDHKAAVLFEYISFAVFCLVVFALMVIILVQNKIPFSLIARLAGLQLLFAALLSLKEEFFFRWLLTNSIVDSTVKEGTKKPLVIALLLVGIFWGIYHGFFGEGVGSGIVSAVACFVVSVYWGFLTLQNGTIRKGFVGHLFIELYGFYLMYMPILTDLGYIGK